MPPFTHRGHRTVAAILGITLGLGVLPVAASAAPAAAAPSARAATTSVSASRATPDLTRLRAALPPDLTDRAAAFLGARGIEPVDLEAVIDPEDHECGPTEVDRYLDAHLGLTEQQTMVLQETGADMYPTIAAMLLGDAEGTGRYGMDGSHSKQIGHAWKKLRTFWDEDSTEVELAPMHGTVLTDPEQLVAVLVALEVDPEAAATIAEQLVPVFDTPEWWYGNHPILTFNAFAAPGMEEFGTPDRIVMGDGILWLYDGLGHGDVAPQVVLAHENVHQLQLDTGVFEAQGEVPEEDQPDTTRFTELQADAGAAYSVSHPRGLSMQWNRVRDVLPVFQGIGDCQFASPGHHGTPNQRLAAGTWGYELQETARPRGKVLPSVTFFARFDAAYPVLTAPDAR